MIKRDEDDYEAENRGKFVTVLYFISNAISGEFFSDKWSMYFHVFYVKKSNKWYSLPFRQLT